MTESAQARPMIAEPIGITIAVAVPKAKQQDDDCRGDPDRVADPGLGLRELLADVAADRGLEAGRFGRLAASRTASACSSVSSPGPTPRTTGK